MVLTRPTWLTSGRVIIFCLCLAVGFLFYVSYWKAKPVDSQALLKQMRTETAAKLNTALKMRDATIKKQATRITAVEKNNVTLAKKMEGLKNEASSITAPKTNKEIRDRFTKRKFPPLP